MTVADLSIGPDDHFLDAPTQGRRKTRSSSGEKTTKAPVKEQISESRMLSNVIGFGSESDVESSSEEEIVVKQAVGALYCWCFAIELL